MKLPLICSLFLVLVSLCAPSALAAGDTPMDKAFERLEGAYKKLSEGLKAPSESAKDSYVKLAEVMQAEARKARDLDPKMTAGLPEADRAAFLEKFRAAMDRFNGNIDKLVGALKASQWDEANKLMETLKLEKKDGHKTFRKKD